MISDKQKEPFINEVCLEVQKARSYEELDQMVTAYVDGFGAMNSLSLDDMDKIQNEIYKRISL